MKKLSVIIPCFNEELNIKDTYLTVKSILENLSDYDYEIIFSDNDSIDNSQNILRDLAKDDKKLKAIFNNRNFGCDRSIANGLFSATGDAAIFICCDRQDPPELITEFVKGWEKGNKVVWGQKLSSKESLIMFTARNLYYEIIKFLSPIKQYSQVIGFGLYDREVLEELKSLRDPEPILRNIIPQLGYKPFLIQYKQNKREKGVTSHNFFSLMDYALNSLVHTSKVPMKLMIYIGMVTGVISFLIGCIYLIYKLLHWDTFSAGVAPLIVSFSFLFSIQMFFMGIIGEYIISILDRVAFTKHVVEKERINF